MNARTGTMRVLTILAVGAIGLAFTVTTSAQVQTSTSTTSHGTTHQVKVEKAEVLSVEGNDVFVKMEDGSIRHIANVSDSARVTVDGREIGVHELKPGNIRQPQIQNQAIEFFLRQRQQRFRPRTGRGNLDIVMAQ